MTRDTLVQVRGLSKRFDVSPPWLNRVIERKPRQLLQAVSEVDFDIERGQTLALVGESGSGKSTLLGILATLDQPSEGEVWLCGQAVHQLTEEQRAQIRMQHIGFVFQSFQLLPQLSALENVMLPLRLRKDFDYKTAEKKALDWLHRVGLSRQVEQTPKVLSGGEQQRVAIARALIAEPQIIFADEPTGNLDGQTAQEIESLLFDLNRELGTTLILVTHDRNLASLCQRHVELDDGRLKTVQGS